TPDGGRNFVHQLRTDPQPHPAAFRGPTAPGPGDGGIFVVITLDLSAAALLPFRFAISPFRETLEAGRAIVSRDQIGARAELLDGYPRTFERGRRNDLLQL